MPGKESIPCEGGEAVKERDEILSCSTQDIRDLHRYIEKMHESECICVLGGEEEIDKEADIFDRTEALFLQY